MGQAGGQAGLGRVPVDPSAGADAGTPTAAGRSNWAHNGGREDSPAAQPC